MNEELKLLPCPFCGGKPKHKTYMDACISVSCMNCGIGFGYFGDKEESNKEVIEKWNTRHYPPEVQQAVERMKPKKVIPEKVYWAPKNRGAYFIRFLCPTCGGIANRATNREFCNNNGCGQRLDWSE